MTDAMRIIAIVLLVGIVLQTVRVLVMYSAVFSLSKGQDRQLPAHVAAIALSYLFYTLGSILHLVASNENLLSSSIFLAANAAVGHFALFNVLKYERRKFTLYTNEPGTVIK